MKRKKEVSDWETLKSGAMKHCDGEWWASSYLDGWFFYNRSFDNILGPFKTFEDGLKKWKAKS